MKPLRWFLIALLLQSAALFTTAHANPEPNSPAAVVQALYRSASRHFGFSPDAVKANRPWLAPELYARLWKKVNEPVAKGDAPDIEGDVFLNSQEGDDKFFVGKTSIDRDKATVEVTVTLPGEKRVYHALLKQINGTWKVTDIDYGKDGKLTDLLK